MTKAQLRDLVKREGRIKTNPNLDTLIDGIVAEILTDFCNLARFYELLKENVSITLVDGQRQYDLPADFNNIQSFRYARGPNPTCWREVAPFTDAIARTSPTSGFPRFYKLVGTKVSLFPYGNIVVQDQLLIDYYSIPTAGFVLDSDPFPVPRLEAAVKKAAIARVQRFHSSLDEGKMTDQDSGSSFNASNAATH